MDYHIALAIIYIFIFLFGAVIASFLNVVIYRLPIGLSVAKGRSFCPQCHETLKPFDMVPILSWLWLRGKCRFCKAPISPRYPIVETLGGLIFLAAFAALGFTAYGVIAALCGVILLGISFIDWDTMTIPDSLQIALALVAVASIFCNPNFQWGTALIGAFAVSLPMFLMTLFIPGAFGFGDVKLMFVCGFLLGWQNILVGMFIALVLGGGYGIYLLATKRINRKEHFPFGPFLAIGVYFSLLWGDALIQWYLHLFF